MNPNITLASGQDGTGNRTYLQEIGGSAPSPSPGNAAQSLLHWAHMGVRSRAGERPAGSSFLRMTEGPVLCPKPISLYITTSQGRSDGGRRAQGAVWKHSLSHRWQFPSRSCLFLGHSVHQQINVTKIIGYQFYDRHYFRGLRSEQKSLPPGRLQSIE